MLRHVITILVVFKCLCLCESIELDKLDRKHFGSFRKIEKNVSSE
jgi:hypothetical protein